MPHSEASGRKNPPPFRSAFLLPLAGIPVPDGVGLFFTARGGGVSQGAWADFNLATHVGDLPEAVAENRRRLMMALDAPLENLRTASQVHGVQTVVATPAPPAEPPEADALVTNRPGLTLGVLTADCAPVLLADPVARVIGAAHAGWRGALAGVVESCLAAMAALDASPGRCHAFIGPCIRPPAFVVGPEVREQFLQVGRERDADFGAHFVPDSQEGRFQLDLAGFLMRRLADHGISPENICDLGLCTYADAARFFSHRRASHRDELPCGRQMSGIRLL